MNKTLLQLNSSLYAEGGQSSRLAAQLVARWREKHPGATVSRAISRVTRCRT